MWTLIEQVRFQNTRKYSAQWDHRRILLHHTVKMIILKLIHVSSLTRFLEVCGVGDSEEQTKHKRAYELKGIPINAYLIETGEFRWTPTFQACRDKENAKKILQVLKKMPEDRRAVWASRLDTEQTKMTCPIIRKEADLCNEFDQLCDAYKRPKSKGTDKRR